MKSLFGHRIAAYLVLTFVTFVALLLSSCSGGMATSTAADFYKNKTVDLVITCSPGCSADRLAQSMLEPFSKALGTNVRLVEKRAGGGVEGYVYTYQAKPDGLTIGVGTVLSPVFNQIFKAPGAIYKMQDFISLAGVGNEFLTFIVKPDGAYQTIETLKAGKGIKLAGASLRGNVTLGNMALAEILGLDAKVVSGYSGPQEAVQAVLNGEAAGAANIQSSFISFVDGKMVKALFNVTEKRQAGFYSNVPALPELVKLNDQQMQSLRLWSNDLIQRQILFTTPGVPADRVTYLRGVFDKLMKDTNFQKTVSRGMGYEILDWISGEDTAKQVDAVMKRESDLTKSMEGLIAKFKL